MPADAAVTAQRYTVRVRWLASVRNARFVGSLGTMLLVVTVAFLPWLLMSWRDREQRVLPLSVTFPVRAGQYRSPLFYPTRDDEYQIDLSPLPDRTPLRLRWKVISQNGLVLASGDYREGVGGGTSALLQRTYKPPVRSAQQLVLDIESVQTYDTTLRVEEPEEILSSSVALPFVMIWAALVITVSCCVLLTVYLIRRSYRRV